MPKRERTLKGIKRLSHSPTKALTFGPLHRLGRFVLRLTRHEIRAIQVLDICYATNVLWCSVTGNMYLLVLLRVARSAEALAIGLGLYCTGSKDKPGRRHRLATGVALFRRAISAAHSDLSAAWCRICCLRHAPNLHPGFPQRSVIRTFRGGP